MKQVGILSADGHILCSEPEAPEAVDDVVSSHALAAVPGATLDVLRLADGQTVLRVRRTSGAYDSYAIVPSSLLLPEVGMDGSPVRAYAAIYDADGLLIGESGTRPALAQPFGAKLKSARYGLRVELDAPHEMLPSAKQGLSWLRLLVSGIVIAALGCVVAILMRRKPHDPVAELAPR